MTSSDAQQRPGDHEHSCSDQQAAHWAVRHRSRYGDSAMVPPFLARAASSPLSRSGPRSVTGEHVSRASRMQRPVSYTHLRAHETPEHLVCRLLLEKKKKQKHTTE